MKFTRTPWCLLAILFCLHAKAQVSVTTQHNNLERTGWNNQETILNKDNVTSGKFGKVFTRTVDDQIYAQPLILSNVSLAGGVHNLLIVATVNNTVYAFDADSSGKQYNTPYWKANLTPAGSRPVHYTDMTGACSGNYLDFQGNIGVVGTPVIDPATLTIYLVTRSVNNSNVYKQYLHALDIATGQERQNSPVEIKASIKGKGQGSTSAGVLNFDPLKQNQRPGLLLLNGIVYIGYSSHCDWRPYHGWFLGYDATSLQQKVVYNTTPEGADGGIWMSGSAPAVDEQGNIYLSVGNGTVGLNGDETNTINRGESLLKLKPEGSTLSVQSYFTPKNWEALEDADLDFGVTEAMLIPNSTTIMTGCKDGSIYVTDRNNMGGYNEDENKVLQTIKLTTANHLRSSFAYYKGASKEYAYTWSENALLKALPFDRTTNVFDLNNVQNSGIAGPAGNNGAFMAVSSNGSDDNTAILWASYASNCDAIRKVCPGVLRAIDATNVNHELWNSHINPSDDIGNFAKFVCPTVANGKVYMATFSNQVVVYGLLENADDCPSENIALKKPAVASSVENGNKYPATLAVDGNATTRWSSQVSDPQWIYVDLKDTYDLCRVVLKWEEAKAADFDIQVSDDAANWTTVQSVTGNTSATNIINLKASGRYVRMNGKKRATYWGYSLYEFEVYGKVKTTCVAPDNVRISSTTDSSATIHWTANDAASYSIQYKPVSASTWTTATSTADSLVIKGLSCATDYLYQVASVCSAATSDYSASNGFTTSTCSTTCGFLPTRWNTLDIGGVNIAGNACFDKDTFLLKGSGTISGTSDAFRFAYQGQANDAQYIAHIKPQSVMEQGSMIGLMLRDDLTAEAKNAFVGISGPGSAVFQYRNATGQATTTHASLTSVSYPHFVKLVKTGTQFSAYASADSITWKPLGNTIDLGFGNGSYYVGLAAANANISTPVTAQATFTSGTLDILPEAFTDLKAVLVKDNLVKISWNYDNVSSGSYFIAERSEDGTHFTEAGRVAAHSSSAYEVLDNHTINGTVYYRVKLVSISGQTEYSSIVKIKSASDNSITVSPNPVKESFEVVSKAGAIISVQVLDLTGRTIKTISFGGNSTVASIAFSKEPAGMYMLKVKTTTGVYQYKMIKN